MDITNKSTPLGMNAPLPGHSSTLLTQLRTLRLSGMLETLETRHRQAIADHWSYMDFLVRLLEDEIERRAHKQLSTRLRRGALSTSKSLDDFSFSFNPAINRQQILALSSCDFIRDKRNVLICGPSGVGKSHLAQAIGQEACRLGMDVLFVNTHKMLAHLGGGRADNTWERRLATYLRPDLLVLDDFGLRALVPPGPEDLYDVINERYEKGSILLTSNRAPSEWPALFADPLLASAGLDRLADRAEIVVIRGESYRAQGRKSLCDLPSTRGDQRPITGDKSPIISDQSPITSDQSPITSEGAPVQLPGVAQSIGQDADAF